MKNGLVLFFATLCASTFAGDAAGHGGGTLARLLTHAKNEIVRKFPSLPPYMIDAGLIDFGTENLKLWYISNHRRISKELDSLKLEATTAQIKDSFEGYDSWIRVSRTGDFVVEYNSDVENYQRLVGVTNLRYRHSGNTEITPSISDVGEYLLHEIGHRYGLDEQDAWAFAQRLSPHFTFNQPLKPRTCRYGRRGDRTLYTIGGTIIAAPSKENQTSKDVIFKLSYRLDPDLYMLLFFVHDEVRNKRVFELMATADATITTDTNEEGGWWVTCH